MSRTPLPKLQLALLLYLQLAEPITSTVIYPFVNQAVRRIGVTGGDEKKTGYYAGLIESCFYLTEAFCVLQWGRVSDRIGRKPVLIVGLLGLTLSMLGFGLSNQFWALVLSRCLQGALNGNIGVTKSMMAEITDASNMAQGFAFLPVMWCIGSTLGPLMGGLLSNPADRWPDLYASEFWKTYPYFLPCFAAACYSVSAVILIAIGLKETLPAALERAERRKQRKRGRMLSSDTERPSNSTDYVPLLSVIEPLEDIADGVSIGFSKMKENSGETYHKIQTNTESINTQHSNVPDEREEERLDTSYPPQLERGQGFELDSTPPTLRSLLVPRVMIPIVNYGFIAFLELALVVLQPLMYSSSLATGGLGLGTRTIGLILGVWGTLNVLIQVLGFEPVHARMGTRPLFMLGLAVYVPCFCAFPLMQRLALRTGGVGAAAGSVLAAQLVLFYPSMMASACIYMFISDSAPSRAALGATNGLAQTIASIVRALAPAAASSLFAVSLERNLAHGTLVYWLLAAVAVVGICAATRLPSHLRSHV